MSRRLAAAVGVAALAALAFAPATTTTTTDGTPDAPVAATAEHSQQDGVLVSHDGTEIHYTLFRPAGASASAPVPMVLSSHGWGGSRTDDMDVWMDAGFGGLSFDQRGFGDSGDLAYTQDPTREGGDVAALLDLVAGLDWVARDHDARDSVFGPRDPVVFAVGGSYGGGYQTVGALTEIATHGDTRFDALAPEITWYDLPTSLAPSGVSRSVWLSALYAAAVADVPQHTHLGYAWGATTGRFPDGSVPGVPDLEEIFRTNSPAGFVEGGGTFVPDGGVRLTVPTLWRQGSSDTLFNLNQGVANLEQVDPSVADQSFLVAYNGGHVLPTALPAGGAVAGDPCSDAARPGGWTQLRIEFFRTVAAGGSTADTLPTRYAIADMDGACVTTDDVRTTTPVPVGVDVEVATGTATTTGVGAPQHLPLFTAEETTVIAGIPTVDATWTSAGVDQRVFLGLAKGTSPLDATVMQHQMQPHREEAPSTGHAITVELGGGGMTVRAGETVYLVVSPFVELYAAHGSARTPGVVALTDVTVDLPFRAGP